jgi:hypothetical protein
MSELDPRMRAALRRPVAKADEGDGVPNPQRTDYQGIPVIIDRPTGFVQTGTAADGTSWERTYSFDYGYIENTAGGDGEGLDVFLGPETDAQTAHWVTQLKGADFDEFKVMLGFADQAAAIQAYLDHIPREHLGGVYPVSINVMRSLLGIEPPEGIELQKAAARAAEQVRKARRSAVAGELARLHKQHPEALVECLAEVMSAAQLEPLQELPAAEPYEAQVIKEGLPAHVCKISALPSERYALGVVLEPDVTDAQGDTYSAKEIEKAEQGYMTDFQNIGLQHKAFVNDRVKLVECYIAPVDFELNGSAIKRGTWLIGVKVLDDGLWKQMQSGELSGFSIAGFAKRTPIEQACRDRDRHKR